MQVWQEAKRAEMLLNQRFCLLYWYIVYALFYTLLLKLNADNGLSVFWGMLRHWFSCIKSCISLWFVNPHFSK